MSFRARLTILIKSFFIKSFFPRISFRTLVSIFLIILCLWYVRKMRETRLELEEKRDVIKSDNGDILSKTVNRMSPRKLVQQAQPPKSVQNERPPKSIQPNKSLKTIQQSEHPKRQETKKILTETELLSLLAKHCDVNIEEFNVKLEGTEVLSMRDYKKQLAASFTKRYINSVNKTKIATTLRTYKASQNRTDPAKGLYDRVEKLDVKKINLELQKIKEQRIKNGDDDILKIREVRQAMHDPDFKVPNLIHFVWFGDKRFMVHQYMAIIAALRYQKPKVILFHYDEEPTSDYWLALKNIAGSTLKLVKRSRPKEIFGHKITKVVHQSDVVRMEVLMEVGGIYLDLDSIVLKSVDKFRKYDLVLPRPDRYYSLANAIIFANKDSWFMRRWYNEYKYFKHDDWSYNSLYVPGSISYYFPDTVHVTEKELCRPNWGETDMLFKGVFNWEPIYITHLFARLLLKKDGMVERPLKQLAVLNTTYGEIARHVIWGDKRIRDVTDWIVTCDLEKQLRL